MTTVNENNKSTVLYASRTWWGTFLPNLGTLGLWGSRIIRYVRDGWTYRRTDRRTKATLIALFPTGRGIKKTSVQTHVSSPAHLRTYALRKRTLT